VLFRQTFETGAAGWIAFGPGGVVRAEHGALSLDYNFGAKQIVAAILPAPPAFARMRRIRFRAKSDYDTALGVFLSEKQPGGGRYFAWFWSPANTWQQIDLAPADFAVSDGPQDPVDADGKLDIDAVESIGVVDVSQIFAQAPANPDIPIVINRPAGAHTMQLADFQLLSSAAPAAPVGVVDRFDREFLKWITLGGMNLKLGASDNPLHMRALQATYRQAEGQLPVLMRRLSNFDLSKATRLSFDIASERESTLVLSLETKTGARFTLQIYPPGAREVFHVGLKLADFQGQGKLDPAQLKSLSILDATAAAGGAEGSNTIWIGNVEMQP